MPNWAGGQVSITGKSKNVCAFIGRFIGYDEEVSAERKYFARSFLADKKAEVIEDARRQLAFAPGETGTVSIFVDFAWSAYTCIISGYPEHNPDRLATLAEACMEDGVSVEIRTTECGIGFYEIISCDAQGELDTRCGDLNVGRCSKCGEMQSLDPWENPEEQECCECGHIGLIELSMEELRKMEEEK